MDNIHEHVPHGKVDDGVGGAVDEKEEVTYTDGIDIQIGLWVMLCLNGAWHLLRF